ncbi:unnamed protein product [Microthlaspi erraticum]|uniref:Phorbol-ester/DAG-type domain-containing protein n=1 Tax=Microthlaspi erraticum TaxID=1685480 RepID=A0A6D2HMU2_9BRAS|nr:unnamed protein product [Microthlaspi erraticum]
MGEEKGPRCLVSDPGKPHNLSRRAGYKIKHDCFVCGENSVVDENRLVEEYREYEEKGYFERRPFLEAFERNRYHYYCAKCDLEFHSECIKFPSKMIHPYHPQHPLTFTFLNYEKGIMADTSFREFYHVLASFEMDLAEYLKRIRPKSNIMFDKCTWCRNHLGEWFYRCSICNFSLDFHCAQKFPPLTIQNPKSHHHSLTLFPRPLSFPCDACGLINVLEPSYACYQCSYVVHKICIDLPRVIKITRHPHRLSYAPYLPTKVSSCRVCYKNMDIKYGHYSCNHEDCSYVVHSKCATHENIWDGREFEWEPESNQTEDIPPFIEVGKDMIEHFCHAHHILRLEKSVDSEKQCHAYAESLCSEYRDSSCSACTRLSSGLKYKCKEIGCMSHIQLGITCILVPECFTHKSHEEHLLFISTTNDEIICQGCNGSIQGDHLHCTECEYSICYKCATIPNEIYHKYDDSPLSLCYGKSDVDDDEVWWCEVCEERLDPREWFCTTNSDQWCTTIHHECLFGDSAYLMAGQMASRFDVEAVGNASSSRPICSICHHRCPQPVYLRVHSKDWSNVRSIEEEDTILCSFRCLSHIPPLPPQ